MKYMRNAPALALAISILGLGLASAQDGGGGCGGCCGGGPEQEASGAPAAVPVGGHGGTLTTTKEHRLEVAFQRDAVVVYVQDAQQRPVDLRGVRAQAEVTYAGGGRPRQAIPLRHVPGQDGAPGRLEAALDLARVQEGEVTATIRIANLPSAREREVELRAPFRLARLVEYACPMRCVPAQGEPGQCSRCGMDLVASRPFIHACSMHPEVTSHDPRARCWLCDMALERRADAAEIPRDAVEPAPRPTTPAPAQALYRCSMDGGERTTPGSCPKCGMRLGEESRVR